LYFLGYYDLSFLDRYKVLGEIFNDVPASSNPNGASTFFDPSTLMVDDLPGTETDTNAETTVSDPSSDNQTLRDPTEEPSSVSALPEDSLYYETKSVKSVFEADKLPDKLLTTSRTGSKTVTDLLASGYQTLGVSYSEAGLSIFASEPVEGEENAETAGVSVPEIVTAEYVPGETVLGKLTFSFQLPNSFSLRKRQITRQVVNHPSDDGEWYVTTETSREQRPAIELYMGYILMDDGKNLSMIASDATPLSVMDETVYAPAFARDRYDRPLFYRTSETGETQYVYLAMDGKNFIRTEYDELEEGRGLNFDYPASYGKTDSSITTDKNGGTGKMAYVNKGVGMVTGYDFTDAFAFSEGLAAVTTTKNRNGMYFIDENGKRAFETWIYYFNEHNRDGYANLVKPLTNGIENIGFYYFENGLTRVRTQTIDAYNWAYVRRIRLMRDEHILIRPDGSEYELPAGYQLEGYSDGMILLSKDDRYGFIDYTGEWIAQPIYTSATPFVCGLATLKTEDGRVGMIDTEGNIVLQFTYDYISQVSDGLIAAYRRENGWTILKMMEKDV
ncbi:MAG: WG repeat-containing protein, partial [Clostridia bacterium]|nr:WG repeat-containing protein [Clostridia bacterium]